MDAPLPPPYEEQTFYDYFELAKVAHTRQMSQLREENGRLKEQIHTLLNRASPRELPGKAANADISMASIEMPGQPVTHRKLHSAALESTTSCDADDLLLNGLGEIILLEREPVAPQEGSDTVDNLGEIIMPEHEPIAAPKKTHSTLRFQDVSGSVRPAVPCDHVPLLSLTSQNSISQASSRSSGMTRWGMEGDFTNMTNSKAVDGWGKICGVLMELRDSETAIIHPSWVLSLHELSLLSSRTPPSSTHHLTERVLKVNGAYQHLCCRSFSPDSRFVVVWQCLGMLLCVYEIVMFPMQVIELIISSETFAALNLSVIIFWSIDIAISIQTAFHRNDGTKEVRHFEILKRYAKTWMALDVTIVVFDWMALAVEGGSVKGVSSVMRFARLLRVVRLLKLGPQMVNFMGQLHSEVVLSVAKIFSYLFVILVLNHYIACILYACWNWSGFDLTNRHRYLVCLHWAIAHSALGSMDISPRSGFERLFSTLVMVLSMVVFSTFLSSITAAITRLSDLHGYRVKQEGLMRKFFDENHISRELSSRIWTFMWKHNHTGKQRLRASDVDCFSLLPSSLLAEIKVEMFLPILVAHPMFEFCMEQCPASMVQVCMTAIEQTIVRPSEEMLWTMDAEVKSIFFVVDGDLLYKPAWDEKYYYQQDVTLRKGMWACEAALWCQNARVYGPLIGGTAGAVVVQVFAKGFQEIMQTNTLSLTLLDYARLFIEKFNDCSREPFYLDYLFNDPYVIQELVVSAKQRRFGTTRRRKLLGSGQGSFQRIWSGLTKPDFRTSPEFRSVTSQISKQ